MLAMLTSYKTDVKSTVLFITNFFLLHLMFFSPVPSSQESFFIWIWELRLVPLKPLFFSLFPWNIFLAGFPCPCTLDQGPPPLYFEDPECSQLRAYHLNYLASNAHLSHRQCLEDSLADWSEGTSHRRRYSCALGCTPTLLLLGPFCTAMEWCW